MKVLIISANKMNFSPSGPAYIAGAARKAGHTVKVFDCLFTDDISHELKTCVTEFKPNVIGISIRTVAGMVYDENTEYNMKPFDNRVFVKEIVDCIKSITSVPIIPGGPGFNYFGEDWLNYLDLDYGLRGEAEISFPQYLHILENGGDINIIPGCISRKNSQFLKCPRDRIKNFDTTSDPAYDLFNINMYIERNIPAGIFTKRGCAFQCSFCPYSSLEGTRYRLKSPERVVNEIEYLKNLNNSILIEFCDNCFNFPLKHAESICKEMIRRDIDTEWRSIDIKPIRLTDEGVKLFKESGCVYLNLATETASEKMLKNMHRGYSVEQIRKSLSCLSNSEIPYGVSLLLGTPGETIDTIKETFSVIDSFPVPSLSVTIGMNFWTHHQPMLSDLLKNGEISPDENLFDEIHYISHELPKDFMINLIQELKERKNCSVYVFKPYAEF
jgi:radical SAM superfamily enzyme YgiQ (UPF0313 family)